MASIVSQEIQNPFDGRGDQSQKHECREVAERLAHAARERCDDVEYDGEGAKGPRKFEVSPGLDASTRNGRRGVGHFVGGDFRVADIPGSIEQLDDVDVSWVEGECGSEGFDRFGSIATEEVGGTERVKYGG